MRPPIFSVASGGSLAQQYMSRARLFRQAAIDLREYVSGQQNWPKYAMLTHAIELALKAYVLNSGYSMEAPRPPNHDLNSWYHLALGYGLPVNEAVARHIQVLNVLHQNHYMRYPQDFDGPVPGVDNIADDTVDWLLDACTRVINRG